MYFNGFCYWIASEKQKEYQDRYDRDEDDYPRQSLIGADPILGMHDAFGVWVLNSFGNVKSCWTKRLTTDPIKGVEKDLVSWKKDEMLMIAKDGRILTYNFEAQKFKYIVPTASVHPCNAEAVICVNSIVPVTPAEKQQS
ncbi:uncharacterized protein LOC126800860 [Argentina anserina]|uniref:uncharacterized protein LOC126800860 n=1 Tax=Argentina anserina TaxID=57926 RepID=UPI00217628A9|nr:uncharacterized protein LOC126800860 [Potentilla anserina]